MDQNKTDVGNLRDSKCYLSALGTRVIGGFMHGFRAIFIKPGPT